MLRQFEDITFDLTEREKRLVPKFIKWLSEKYGRHNAISNKKIREGLEEKKNIKISDARIRKIIEEISINDLLPGLVANSTGYYITHDPHELKRYYKSLEGRENAIRKRREAIGRHLKQVYILKQSQLELNA